MTLDIRTYMELRSAGYSAEDIKSYAESMQAPAPAPAPAPDPNSDLLQAILSAVQGGNIRNSNMPDDTRTTETILAEIINPPQKQK